MSHNTWPGNFRHAMTQAEHRQWNAHNWPGTRQICCRCEQETGRCEEDEITLESGEGPLCVECWHQTDEYKKAVVPTAEYGLDRLNKPATLNTSACSRG